jgi:hypothetical protein
MEYKEAVTRLAPCGLDCSRCADYSGGEIQKLSVRLVDLLNGYLRVARMKKDIKPVFTGYPQFEEVLKSFTQAACTGCRGDKVLCPFECVARVCSREKGVDFCFQCGEFPCSKIDTRIRERWLGFNLRMKVIGVEEFYQEQSRLPRY